MGKYTSSWIKVIWIVQYRFISLYSSTVSQKICYTHRSSEQTKFTHWDKIRWLYIMWFMTNFRDDKNSVAFFFFKFLATFEYSQCTAYNNTHSLNSNRLVIWSKTRRHSRLIARFETGIWVAVWTRKIAMWVHYIYTYSDEDGGGSAY